MGGASASLKEQRQYIDVNNKARVYFHELLNPACQVDNEEGNGGREKK